MVIDKKKLALIHIIKKELGLSDAAYRDILNKAVGVTSAKDLDEDSFRKLMNYFVRSRHYRAAPNAITLRQKMFIKNLVRDIGWDEKHFGNFIHKYYHKKIADELTKREAMKVIESLKNISAHRQMEME